MKSITEIFRHIFLNNIWQGDTPSGPGSTLKATAALRARLQEVFAMLRIRTLVDAPCGDMNWMRHLDYKFDKFIGVDVVPTIIEQLKSETFPAEYHFQINNIVTDILPAADAVFCRDCLVHLPFSDTDEVVRRWRLAGFRYAFATTFTGREENADCPVGGWRPLNMQRAPFNWPTPILIIPENDPHLVDDYPDKSLGVWAL